HIIENRNFLNTKKADTIPTSSNKNTMVTHVVPSPNVWGVNVSPSVKLGDIKAKYKEMKIKK
ncbi:hypothetical protein, partial [Leuconostoc pseudomesenteroides]|uniref:hypothetical protein n=1 Tax=Leuconostoc pseudomesenteroides TaxID=33968 RepID=UPI0028A12560